MAAITSSALARLPLFKQPQQRTLRSDRATADHAMVDDKQVTFDENHAMVDHIHTDDDHPMADHSMVDDNHAMADHTMVGRRYRHAAGRRPAERHRTPTLTCVSVGRGMRSGQSVRGYDLEGALSSGPMRS